MNPVADTHVTDDVYQQATAQFDESELLDLTLAIAAISAQTEAGSYRSEAAR